MLEAAATRGLGFGFNETTVQGRVGVPALHRQAAGIQSLVNASNILDLLHANTIVGSDNKPEDPKTLVVSTLRGQGFWQAW